MRTPIAFILPFLVTYLYAQKITLTKADDDFARADAYAKEVKYDSAIFYFSRALKVYEVEKNWNKIARCHYRLAQGYHYQGQFTKGLELVNKALAISQEKLGDSEELGFSHFVLSDILMSSANYDKALLHGKKSLAVFMKVYPPDDPHIAKAYRIIGVIYAYKNDFEKSLQYQKKGLEIFIKAHGEIHRDVASSYFSMSMMYLEMENVKLGLECSYKSIEVYEKALGRNSIALVRPYNILVQILMDTKDYNNALKFSLKALRLSPDNDHSTGTVLLYRNLAVIYDALGDNKSAMVYSKKAISLGKEIFGEKHPAISSIYRNQSLFHEAKGNYDSILYYDQKSLIANIESFNDENIFSTPTELKGIDRNELYNSIKVKVSALKQKYKTEKNIKVLVLCLETYKWADHVLEESRRAHLNHQDKWELSRIAVELYSGAIETCLMLKKETNETKYDELAFFFSERNKAAALTEEFSNIVAKGSSLLPDTLLALEQQLKENISDLKTKIIIAKQKQRVEKKESTDFDNQLLKQYQRSDSLTLLMEKEYPRYYAAKYQHDKLSVKEIQQKIPKGTVLLEYFDSKDLMYLFLIAQKQYQVFSIPKDDQYIQNIDLFNKSIRPSMLELQTNTNYVNYTNSAYKLFEILLKGPLAMIEKSEPVDKMVIVPDGLLSYIPFDMLLATKPKNRDGNFGALNYLLRKYTISYGYSAALNFQPHDQLNVEANDKNYLSFASEYQGKPDSSSIIALGKFRGDVLPLKWNQHEVRFLSDKVDGDYFVGSDATEKRFKEQAGAYAVIHLAMHALIDDEDPMNSKLVFTHDNDTIEDGYLHAFELYGMQLNAQLAVLSACNTGSGKLAQGEGIMSLGRAFSYAGVPSLVISHWQVDDEATSSLMQFFYQNLGDGMTKSEALRQAKLSYLSQASPTKIHPFYWGAFLTIGNDRPIELKQSYLYYYIAAIVLVLTSLYFWRFRK